MVHRRNKDENASKLCGVVLSLMEWRARKGPEGFTGSTGQTRAMTACMDERRHCWQ